MYEPGRHEVGAELGAVIEERRSLISLAYRLLGSVTDAEDVVQETYLRWYSLSGEQQEQISVPAAWLMKVTSRICLDQLRSARSRRERYVGEWLPEPVPDSFPWSSHHPVSSTADPADRITLDESVTMAFLVLLESMTPAERVALILHDVYRYSFPEIAEIVGRSPEASRQLASSARRKARSAQHGAAQAGGAVQAGEYAGIVKTFKVAWENGDIRALMGILDSHATAIIDGGGLVSAELHPIHGAERIARFFLGIAGRQPGLTILERTVNGNPGLLAEAGGSTLAVISVDVANDTIKQVWAVRNPGKLRLWTSGEEG